MAPFRSQETLQREYDLQAPYTVKMNLRLQSNPESPEYLKKLEDSAVFANQVRELIEGETHVIMNTEGRILIFGHGEDYKVSLWIDSDCWGFQINGSTYYELDDEEKVGPSRAIKKIWDTVIPLLPENYIIRGIINPEYPGHEVRMKLLQRLGFSELQANHDVFAIKMNGQLVPLTLDRFMEITQTTPQLLKQKLSVKQINWPGV